MANEINIIAPYKHHGMWVFDDARVGLIQEPFVGGADTLIDHVTAHIADAARGFVMVFSRAPFPGSQHKLVWRQADGTGNIYYSEEFAMEGWLCPALLRYFDHPPPELHVQVKPREP